MHDTKTDFRVAMRQNVMLQQLFNQICDNRTDVLKLHKFNKLGIHYWFEAREFLHIDLRWLYLSFVPT